MVNNTQRIENVMYAPYLPHGNIRSCPFLFLNVVCAFFTLSMGFVCRLSPANSVYNVLCLVFAVSAVILISYIALQITT